MTTTIIEPEIFIFLFFLFTFIIGLDYTWSGYLVIRNRTDEVSKRKLLGLWVIRRFHIPNNKKGNTNTSMNFMYDFKNMGFMTFAGGILITFGSAIIILDLLFRKLT